MARRGTLPTGVHAITKVSLADLLGTFLVEHDMHPTDQGGHGSKGMMDRAMNDGGRESRDPLFAYATNAHTRRHGRRQTR